MFCQEFSGKGCLKIFWVKGKKKGGAYIDPPMDDRGKTGSSPIFDPWSAALYRIQQQIIRGDTSSSYAKYPGSPQYARASAQVSEILKEAGSTYRKETHQYPYAPYQQQRTVPSKHYTSYPQKPAQQHQQQAQAYYYEPTKARIKEFNALVLPINIGTN